jgi:YesN/AraC family two-component response regulator
MTAADAAEGLDVDEHQSESFDVFLLDVRMPNMTGDELAQLLRRRHPDCKVLYFTGFADQLFDRKPTLWDNEAFIEKPAAPTALLEAMSMLLYGDTQGPR